jgi:hypothetical protein
VTDVGGAPEAAGRGGLVVPPRDPAAFAAACVHLLTHDGRRRGLGLAGRAHALAHFTLDRFLGDVRQVYAAHTVAPDDRRGAAGERPLQRAEVRRSDAEHAAVPSLIAARA